MGEIMREHFWACWWLFVIVVLVAENAITNWINQRQPLPQPPSSADAARESE